MPQARQPFLHDLVCLLAAPTQVWSARNGNIGPDESGGGAQGVLHADVRLFSRVEVVIDGAPGEHIATVAEGRELTFVSLLRHVGTDQAQLPDPQVRLDRVRRVTPGRVLEQLTISSQLRVDVEVELSVRFATDLMSIELIKAGRPSNPRPFPAEADDAVEWGGAQLTARLDCPEATLARSTEETELTASWRVLVPAHGAATRVWGVQAQDPGAVVVVATAPPVTLATTSTDHRLRPWLERSLADLDALTMGTPDHPEDRFMAAGAPGISRSSAATACGPPACCCRSTSDWPAARCGFWPAGRARRSSRPPSSSRARSCTSCGAGRSRSGT